MNAQDTAIGTARPMRASWAVGLGAVVVAAAVIAVFAAVPMASHVPGVPRALTVGRVAGMTALALFLMQFALSGRVVWLDRAFGLDVLYRVHAILGACAVMLASAHPLLVAWPRDFSTRLQTEPWWRQWPILLGAGALTLAWLVVVTAAWRVFLRLPYHVWRKIHYLTFVVGIAALVHAFSIGADLQGFGWGYVVCVI
ncbi:MAG: ferric reductase-like transmembrane domain-containing protein, partial [Planctomycetota bacterium]